MNRKILAIFTAILFAMAITGYAYTHWQEIIQIQGAFQIAKLEIIILDCQTPLQILYQDNHTLNLNGTITPNQPTLTNITIKNNGTTPATITHTITPNNTEIWQQYFTYNQNLTTPHELQPQDIITIMQNITLTKTPPQPFTIEIKIIYTATFQSWTDIITITYTLTYQEGG